MKLKYLFPQDKSNNQGVLPAQGRKSKEHFTLKVGHHKIKVLL